MVDRNKLLRALKALDGDRALRGLLVRVLGYEAEGGLVANKRLLSENESAPTVSNKRTVIYKKRLAAPGTRGSSALQGRASATASITHPRILAADCRERGGLPNLDVFPANDLHASCAYCLHHALIAY